MASLMQGRYNLFKPAGAYCGLTFNCTAPVRHYLSCTSTKFCYSFDPVMSEFLKSISVSHGMNVSSTIPKGSATLFQLMHSNKYEATAREMLTISDDEKQKKFKVANFPVLLPTEFAGAFTNDAVKKDAEVIIVDIDNFDNPEVSTDFMFSAITTLPFVAACYKHMRRWRICCGAHTSNTSE